MKRIEIGIKNDDDESKNEDINKIGVKRKTRQDKIRQDEGRQGKAS